MGKRLFLFLMISLYAFFSIDVKLNAKETEEYSVTASMILVLDTSKSMNEENKIGVIKLSEAKKLAEQLCAICKEYNIELTCLTFNDKGKEKEIFKNKKINNKKTFISLIKKIKEIKEIKKSSPNGNCTDQLGAFEKAKKIINKSNSKNKNIIILSDGELDYVGRREYDPNNLTIEEENAVDEFQEECGEFTKIKEQNAFLIGFGNNVTMFSDIENQENGLYYLQYENSIPYIIEGIFKSLDKSINIEEQEYYKRNQIKISLNDGLFRAMICISREPSENAKSLRSDMFTVKRKEEETEKIVEEVPNDFILLKNSIYLFFDYPKEGTYLIDLPEDMWSYYTICLENYQVRSIKISLYEGSSEISEKQLITEGSQKITLYTLNNIMSNLNIQIIVQGDDPDSKYLGKLFYKGEAETYNFTEDNWTNVSKTPSSIKQSWGSSIINRLDFREPTYYQVCMKSGSNYIYSNIIKVVYSEEVILKNGKTKEPIILTELFSGLEEKYFQEEQLLINGIVVDNVEENSSYKRNDREIVFSESGNYEIELDNCLSVQLNIVENTENTSNNQKKGICSYIIDLIKNCIRKFCGLKK